MNSPREELVARPSEEHYHAMTKFNEVIPEDTELFILSYARFWLRGDILFNDQFKLPEEPLESGPLPDPDTILKNARKEKVQYLFFDSTLSPEYTLQNLLDSSEQIGVKADVLLDEGRFFALKLLNS